MSSHAASRRRRPGAGALPAAGIALALAAVAFGADGGLLIGRTTAAEIALTLGGAAVFAAAVLAAPRSERLWGGLALWLFGALAALTAASIVWAVQPSDAWLEASRTLSYLAVFAAGLGLARLAPGRWASLLAGVLLASLAVSVYALLTKVFPASLNPGETYARLREPFGYWNAIGLTAALGAPACLWLGARRAGHMAANALAYPALGLMLFTILMAYSRGSLLALALGCAVWFALVPLRLRGFTVLATSAAGAGIAAAWTFSQDALTKDRVPLPLRTDAGHELGVVLVLLVLGLLAAGLAIGFATARRPPAPRVRRRAGVAVIAALALAPVGLLTDLALSEGGIAGNVSDGWHSLTDPNASTPANDPGRLTAVGSVRARYWNESLKIWKDNPLVGVGAGGYATARPRYRNDTLDVRHSHGYAVQTLADLGLLGMGLSLALLAAWLAGALRATGLRPRDRGLPHGPERIGMLTLLATVVVFGVHSFVDWTWFVPGTAAIALLCAGWLAGRGPLAGPGAGEERAGLRVSPTPPRIAGAAAVLAIAAAAAFAIWQPLRAVHAGNAALDYLSRGAVAQARDAAQVGRERNPLSVEPLFELAVIEDASGRPLAAQAALERAVALQPSNAQTWIRLGEYRLARLGRPRAAIQALSAALFLDPRSTQAQAGFLEATRRARRPATR